MFETLLEDSPTILNVFLFLSTALAMGIVFSLIYTKKKEMDGYHKDMPITFILLPVITVSLCLGVVAITNALSASSSMTYERVGVSIVAALLIIRFRSELRNFEDLTYVFALVGIGIILGFGYLYFALIVYALLILVVFLTKVLGYPSISQKRINIKITVPEDLNYENAFNDVFNKYTEKCVLTRTKTSDLGTLFIVNYEAILKEGFTSKELIDEIRCRNGNLNVIVTLKAFDD